MGASNDEPRISAPRKLGRAQAISSKTSFALRTMEIIRVIVIELSPNHEFLMPV
jgi:hypothetical protein